MENIEVAAAAELQLISAVRRLMSFGYTEGDIEEIVWETINEEKRD